jgi:pyruvate ferredoxin oxidoreductase beta subunit
VAKPKPISEYFKPQRRCRHLTEAEVEFIQVRVDEQYEKLVKKCVVEDKKKEKE